MDKNIYPPALQEIYRCVITAETTITETHRSKQEVGDNFLQLFS